jgi:hypothetical protein
MYRRGIIIPSITLIVMRSFFYIPKANIARVEKSKKETKLRQKRGKFYCFI